MNLKSQISNLKSASRKLKAKSCAGFTLVEAIVAMGVIAVGFVGSLVLLSKSAAQASALKDRVIAAHLAEEGIEVIRNIRDTNWLKDFDWRTGLANTTNGTVNYDSTSVNNGGRQCLKWNGTLYFHPPDNSCNTSFERHIELATKDDPDLVDPSTGQKIKYVEVKSIVQWQEKSFSKSITVIDHLYDWK